ncbi:flavodoxin domain-containing protein [Danxiaibacter flavus]|uniref:Flavodoxin domain-containing protein n=1 Tax=Danxiaibacter flavus TaxID=3049108 RepID=A0ABV3ZBA0_9BACT|nr:flavodoxin domain-containing protein [Chitinophagaceae bacterium DXS]
MLAELKLNTFRELVKNASRDELIWMNGYLSAVVADFSNGETAEITAVASSPALANCTVVYGTETGNSKKVATDFSTRLKKQGVSVKLKSLEQYRINDLSKEQCLLVVISTQGDGEPPAGAKKFYDYILQNNLQLGDLKYAVLALGDSAYPLFCKAGEDVDIRLSSLGAERIVPLRKCDTDYEADATQWLEELLSTSSGKTASASVATATKTKSAKSGKKVFDGTVIATVNLNDKESGKETYHIEIASDEEVEYEPGDSIGIIAFNKPASVGKIIELLDASADQQFSFRDQSHSLEDLLTTKINIQYLPERVVQNYAKLVKKEIPSIRMDLADLLRIYPSDKSMDVQQFVSIMEPIAPRLYSLSSSPAAHGNNEVHITVSRSKFNVDGHQRFGLCSDYLSTLNENDNIKFYIQKNNAFRLPEESKDVIMIGPGTGIAPFRSFLLERDAKGDSGRNWLFFGDQHFVSDFLYQTDLQALFETGVLTKLNTAFSRDQDHKVYVQHRMKEKADELYDWIQSGANIYVCGAKEPMSVDVENTLISIIAEKADISIDAATEYVHQLHESGQYHKDVY